MKIAILIPATSYKRKWTDIKESYLYINTIKSFLTTYNKEHNYKFYIGIDEGDIIYDNTENKEYIIRLLSVMKNVDLQFICFHKDIKKGHVTEMWNHLFKISYNDKYDYFVQCGDDIEFKTKHWIDDCIEVLKNNDDIGVSGPYCNNPRLMTQSVVSRKHMEIFNYYFPPEIINWFCDDWINEVYKSINKLFTLKKHLCLNIGGNPRYDINNDTTFVNNYKVKFQNLKLKSGEVIKSDIEKLKKYIDNLK